MLSFQQGKEGKEGLNALMFRATIGYVRGKIRNMHPGANARKLRQNGVMDMANEFKTNGFKHVCQPPYRHTQTHVHAY